MYSIHAIPGRRSTDGREDASAWRIATCRDHRGVRWAVEQIVLDMADLGYAERDRQAMRIELRQGIARASARGEDGGCLVRYLLDSERAVAVFSDPDEAPGDWAKTDRSAAATAGEFRRGQSTMAAYGTWVRFDPQGRCRSLCRYRTA